jgi:hypothetical protein
MLGFTRDQCRKERPSSRNFLDAGLSGHRGVDRAVKVFCPCLAPLAASISYAAIRNLLPGCAYHPDI